MSQVGGGSWLSEAVDCQHAAQVPPTARLVTQHAACTAAGSEGSGCAGGNNSRTHLYGLPCCSVVMMGLRSFFWRFLPFMLSLLGVEEGAAAPATFLAFSMAAFLMPSEPFMMQRLGVWRCYCKRRLAGLPGSERWYTAVYRTAACERAHTRAVRQVVALAG